MVCSHPTRLQAGMALIAAMVLLIESSSSPLLASADKPRTRKPNIVFILADDLGWYDLGCYGNRFIETPNLDRLAAQGMRFTDAYAAAALCVPARGGIVLGQSPARLKLTNNPSANRLCEDSPVNPAACPNPFVITGPTIGDVLKGAGYATGIVGKWHVGAWTLDRAKDRHGFDVAVGRPSHYSVFKPLEEPARYALLQNGVPKGEPYVVDVLTDHAVEFIESHHDRPFFLYFSHFAVHIPLLAKAEKIAKYRRKLASYEAQPGELANVHYAAMVESVDDSVGRVLDTLRRLKLEDDTIVLFFSDNGGLATTYHASGHQEELQARGCGCYGEFIPATFNGPLRLGKGYLYEGGIREPFIVKWPGVTAAGGVCRTPVMGYDFLPTLCEVAGADRPVGPLDGASLVPLLRDPSSSLDRKALYWHFPHFSNEGSRPSSAVRSGRWKLIEHLENGRIELFDLEKDLGETTNLAGKMPERASQLKTMLTSWRKDVGAAMPTRKPEVDDAQAGKQRPNIVLIMADDMGYSDIGCYGGEIRTPNLDRLAAGGLRFTQFYNTARCCPTRAALMTGLYPHQAGIGHMTNDRGHPGYRGFLNDRCLTIAEVLRSQGYRTMLAGKWHVSPFDFRTRDVATHRQVWPLQRGFDAFYGTLAGGGSYFNPPGLMEGNELIRPDAPDYYYTNRISDKAVEYIRQQGSQVQPFFLYVAYTSPHWPLHASPKDIERYRGAYDKGWDALRAERYRRMIDMGLVDARWQLTARDSEVPAWADAKDKSWQSLRMAVYAAQVDCMDQGIGRIVRALEEKGQLENTLVFFLADNGGCAEELYRDTAWLMNCGIIDKTSPDGRPMQIGNEPSVKPGPADTFASYGLPWANASNTPFRRYKHWVHEGGISSPLIVHWPARIKDRGSLRRQPGHVIDIMATCVDVAGAQYPERFQGRAITPLAGRSLVPAFDDRPIRCEAIYWEHEGNRAIRAHDWKLVSQYPDSWELYNLAVDRTETNDLAKKYPERVELMKTKYERWAQRCNVLGWPVKKAKTVKK